MESNKLQLRIESIWYPLFMNNVVKINERYRLLILRGFVSFCIFIIPKYGYLSTSIYLLSVGMEVDYAYCICTLWDKVKIQRNGYKMSFFLFYAMRKVIKYGTVHISKQLLCCFINFRQTRYTQAISFNLTIASTTRLFIQQHFIKIKILFV